MRADPGGIWICEENVSDGWWRANDRILYQWQFNAGYLAEQTIDQHLAAIRFMEDVLEGKPFERLKVRDVGLVRDVLKAALAAKAEVQKSKSTAAHQASQIMGFLERLIKQDGYKRLPADLPGSIKLPKAAYAKAMPKNDKAYPSIEEAEDLLLAMPRLSVAQKRARAMVAIAYLGALRADTVTSLRICHFDSEYRQILQDADLSRTKNGKSLRIDWFPISDSFLAAVKDWIEGLEGAGLAGQDALFPSLRMLQHRKDLKTSN
ncbi:hypothetical protein shim_27500 [Shimia sp. SK013]|uniref:hypothetical protein n=1 Tax=Shimia sp. SK013 TaxID=1389006 RepID=UPI0006B5C462|nr:hypothetical protein [Shimia sp. SK013]KPA20836.1 hypothetical protein shim_27500 [Shimia sp. SK013]